MVPMLIQYACAIGYEVTFGCARCDKDHHRPKSLHKIGLAIDLHLFKNGRYLRATADHRPLGEFWEQLGGSWGGRFDDGNHYSLEYDGRR